MALTSNLYPLLHYYFSRKPSVVPIISAGVQIQVIYPRRIRRNIDFLTQGAVGFMRGPVYGLPQNRINFDFNHHGLLKFRLN